SGVVDVYDTGTGLWSTSGSLNTPRYGLAAAYAPSTGMIYAFGGFDGSGVSGVIEMMDPTVGVWTPTPNSLSLGDPRFGLGAAYNAGDGQIYITGGYDASFVSSFT